MTAIAKLTSNRKSYRFSRDGRYVHGIMCAGKDDLAIVKWGKVIMGLRATLPNQIGGQVDSLAGRHLERWVDRC